MAVNIANALTRYKVESHIMTTRFSGKLVSRLISGVNYQDFRRNRYLDLPLIWNIRNYCQNNSIKIIHAHTLSWKIALVLKFVTPSLKVIWHDHQGDRVKTKNWLLKRIIHRFSGVISVNESLRDWAQNQLGHKNVMYLSNFIEMGFSNSELMYIKSSQSESNIENIKNTNPDQFDISKTNQIKLNGPDGFKIICVANLRTQKDHLTLIRAFAQLSQNYSNVSLHLVGAESDPNYVDQVRHEVTARALNQVYFYGAVEDVQGLLQQAQIGVLSSVSEGLPMALLEYAAAGLPVVTTDVGACKQVVHDLALVVPPSAPENLFLALSSVIKEYETATTKAEKLKAHVKKHYSEASVIPRLIEFYKTL